jgi:hypothetical protein
MSRPKSFPTEIFVTSENDGTEDAYKKVHETPEAPAELNITKPVGRYLLAEIIMSEKENPPAFPFTPTDKSGQIATTECGMTLRDWFAGMALKGLCANQMPKITGMGYIFPSDWRPYISASFKLADEMLNERSKPPSETNTGK